MFSFGLFALEITREFKIAWALKKEEGCRITKHLSVLVLVVTVIVRPNWIV